ncbi:MAG: UrcA family protein [Pseudomonadota bacterium]|nr:UrcA family protein [Pseudomonadota bacterium]
MVIRTLVSVSALLAAGSAASAQDDVRTAVVTVRAFELSEPAARRSLRMRLERAVETVCATPGRRDAASFRERRHCEKDAMQDVEEQLGYTLADLDNPRRQLALNVTGH